MELMISVCSNLFCSGLPGRVISYLYYLPIYLSINNPYYIHRLFLIKIKENNKDTNRQKVGNMQAAKETYTQYLQHLLQQHNIPYKSQEQFATTSEQSSHIQTKQHNKQQNKQGPLKTNLQGDLVGQQLLRYSRQMLLKDVGYTGQLKLLETKVGIVGAGGIGCPLALYLAAAGIGTIGLFDSDKVQLTNLHRQIGHTTSSIDTPKTSSLKTRMQSINPHIKIKEHPFITVETTHLLDQYDIVIDGSDNPTCRYIVNDYLMGKGKILLSGACIGWQGQVTTYGGDGPCYRCIWGDQQVSMGGCGTLGVIGMLPGFVAMILGVEAMKFIITGKNSLQGQLLTYEGRTCTFRKLKLRNKKLECQACGQKKLDQKTYPYTAANCASSGGPPQVPAKQWSEVIQEIKQNENTVHIDVRPASHFNMLHIENSINIPYEQLKGMDKKGVEQRIRLHKQQQGVRQKENEKELSKEVAGEQVGNVYVSCKVGYMSKFGTDKLRQLGFQHVYNIQGGINQYGRLYDPNIVNL